MFTNPRSRRDLIMFRPLPSLSDRSIRCSCYEYGYTYLVSSYAGRKDVFDIHRLDESSHDDLCTSFYYSYK